MNDEGVLFQKLTIDLKTYGYSAASVVQFSGLKTSPYGCLQSLHKLNCSKISKLTPKNLFFMKLIGNKIQTNLWTEI